MSLRSLSRCRLGLMSRYNLRDLYEKVRSDPMWTVAKLNASSG